MHVPIKVDYGVRALIDIAMYGEDGQFVRAADTSRRAVIPQPYLAQVLHTMKKSGLVSSTRGPGVDTLWLCLPIKFASVQLLIVSIVLKILWNA